MITLESLKVMQSKPKCLIKRNKIKKPGERKEYRIPKESTISKVEDALKDGEILTRAALVVATDLSKDTVKKVTDWMYKNKLILKHHIANVGVSRVYEYRLRTAGDVAIGKWK